MSTIAFDGETAAYDTQAGTSYRIDNAEWHKIGPVNHETYWAVGGTGEADAVRCFMEWVESGAIEDRYPSLCADRAEECNFIAIDREMKVCVFERCGRPCVVASAPFSCGSGSDYAIGAMMAGAPARRAVEIAKSVDPHTGGPVYSYGPLWLKVAN